MAIRVSITALSIAILGVAATAQSHRPRPIRVEAPTFSPAEIDGVYFDDVRSQLVGALPPAGGSPDAQSLAEATAESSGGRWQQLIAASELEDLVKSAKDDLDAVTRSPSKFAGGGFEKARYEFTKLAVAFAVIANYGGDVRWKESALAAAEQFSKTAAAAKIGTIAVFNDAKAKTFVYNDLLRGTKLDTADGPTDWPALLDRGDLMVALEETLRNRIMPATANADQMTASADAIERSANLIALIAEILVQTDMIDAGDEEYCAISAEMLGHTQTLTEALKKSDVAMVQQAVSRINSSCDRCHEGYR